MLIANQTPAGISSGCQTFSKVSSIVIQYRNLRNELTIENFCQPLLMPVNVWVAKQIQKLACSYISKVRLFLIFVYQMTTKLILESNCQPLFGLQKFFDIGPCEMNIELTLESILRIFFHRREKYSQKKLTKKILSKKISQKK